MKLVFANSATVTAPERLMLRGGRWRRRVLRVRYGLILHPRVGPVLIDTGYTAHSTQGAGRSRGLRLYSAALRPRLIAAAQPQAFLARHGLTPDDIGHVIVTHLHADHVSGLRVFDNARFIASAQAWAALCGATPLGNLRHGVFPELLPPDFRRRTLPLEDFPQMETPLGVPARDLFGDGSVQALPLPGHAAGHFGVICRLAQGDVLYGVDTQWLDAALVPGARPGVAARLIADAPGQVGFSSDLVHRFRAEGLGEVVLCHDDTVTAFDAPDMEGDG